MRIFRSVNLTIANEDRHINGGRWLEASSARKPHGTRLKLKDLGGHIPADALKIDEAERKRSLLDRIRGAQLRTKW